MSKELLQDIIEDFNPEKFVRFFREKNRSFAPRKEELFQYNDENFQNGIKLGEIQFAQDLRYELVIGVRANEIDRVERLILVSGKEQDVLVVQREEARAFPHRAGCTHPR